MKPIGLYLHIPFCDGKCAYCNFFSQRAGNDDLDIYTDHLQKSIRAWSKRIQRKVDTVYFGGGTPSLLGHDRLIAILKTVFECFSVMDDAEITVEVNPSSTDELDFAAMKTAGFNRLSIGLQSANENELRILGRRHSVADAERPVKRAQGAGFDNISLDVMLAIPEQTPESLSKTLEFCASCGVQHISSYILKVEPGTAFWKRREALPLFSDEKQAEFYEQTVEKLTELGYRQYEISNFSHTSFESRHNLHYWHDEEYLGLGPSAHSFINGKRFYYDSDFQAFYDDQTEFESRGGDPEEYIMLALRLTEGLIFEKYRERFGEEPNGRIINSAKVLSKNGLCTVDEEGIRLSVKGFLVSNAVIGYLLENT